MQSSRRALRAVAMASFISAALLPTSSALATVRPHSHHREIKTVSASSCANAFLPVTSSPSPAIKSAVVCLINQQRTSRGLGALRANSHLDLSAQRWTQTLVATHQFTHGSNFSARISAAGYDWSVAGENIATGYRTAEAVVQAWMASPGHCRNILDPDYGAVGTGIVDAAISPYSSHPASWTQDFALPMGGHLSNNWGPADSVCGTGSD